MAGITKPSDLFDFDKWASELAKLEERKNKYTQSVIQSNERIQKSYDENIVKLKELGTLMQSLNIKSGSGKGGGSSIGGVGNQIQQTIASLQSYQTHLKSVADLEKLHEKSILELKNGLHALEAQYVSLNPTSATYEAEQRSIANQVKQVTAAITAQSQTLKVAKGAIDQANNSYNKLSKQTADLKNQIRSLPGAFDLTTGAINKNNSAAVALAKQIKINDTALKNIDKTLGNHQRNVGNYKGALTDVIGATLGFTTAVGAMGAALEAIKASMRIIDEFTRLKLGLDAISTSSEQASQRFSFVSSLADKTGQDISKLTTSYVDFAAATRTTALEGASGDRIFAAFTKTFSALGKSSEVAERGLYALQQMISKGKVSSEELNQQLAEALPGSNKIFADALGVSTAALAGMLKKGEVLAVDVLPKVAEALEKTYGDRAQNNLNTISGSFTRFTNQFKLFLDGLNEDKAVSGFFAGLNNGWANSLKGINRLIERQGILNTLLQLATGKADISANANDQNTISEFKNDDIKGRVARLNIEMNRLAKSEADLKKINPWTDFNKEGAKTVKFIDRQKRLVQDLILAQKDLVKNELFESKAVNKPITPKGSSDDPEKKSKRVLTQYEKLNEAAEKLSKRIQDELLADFNAGRPLEISDSVIETWMKLYKQIEAVAKATGQDVPAAFKKLNEQFNIQTLPVINALTPKSVKDTTGRAPNKDGSISTPTTDKTSQLGGLGNLLQSQNTETNKLNNRLDRGQYKKFLDEDKEALRQQLAEIQALELQSQQAVSDNEKDNVNARIKLAEEEFSRKTELAKANYEERKRLQEALTELVSEAGTAVFSIIGDQNAADIAANQAKMDHELELVKGNAEAEKKIKEEYSKKDLQLRQKQAKLDKAEAAFKIAINTAVAISAVSPIVPLMVIAAALGAIQLAVVLAKPLPQFFKGTKDAPAGLAQVGERGPEIRESKGKMYYYEKPTIANLDRGDKIYTASETSKMLNDRSEISNIKSVNESSEQKVGEIIKYQVLLMNGKANPVLDYNKMKESFIDALESQPVSEFNYDEKGMSRYYRKKDLRIKEFNNRYSLGRN